jgi:probable rRNA maturation factor
VTVELTWAVDCPEGVRESALLLAAQETFEREGRGACEFELIFVSDEALAELHERFLQDPSNTDVIAFDLGEDGDGPAGEIYVSVDCAQRVAGLRNVSLERELALYVVHGSLHLCGYDDHEESDRREMRAAEVELLRELGYAPDAAPHEFGS